MSAAGVCSALRLISGGRALRAAGTAVEAGVRAQQVLGARGLAGKRGMATNVQHEQLAERLHGFEAPTVWHEFSPMAAETGAVNLGQGFPDWPCPDFMKEAVGKAMASDHNQYARPAGHLPLVKALAEQYSQTMGREIDALTEVAVCVGSSEALFASLMSLVQDGDEVIILEPAFDLYAAQTKMAGGKSVYVPLRQKAGGEWYVDMDELAAAFTPKTRALVINTPHNPTGKVFTREELTAISEIVLAHERVVVIADEVYQHLVYDDHKHTHIATIPGMWERTVTCGSAGKTFSVTGWKIGWVVAPKHLSTPVMLANNWIQFSVATPLQDAVAQALVLAKEPYKGFPTYYDWLRDMYRSKRDRLLAMLRDAGLEPYVPEGSFFIMANTDAFEVPASYLETPTASCPKMTPDWAFCRMLTLECGVAAIPPSAFYCEQNKPLASKLARFAFCKTEEALDLAKDRLLDARRFHKK